ncbi:MAG: peptidylprolyl isomerase [Defluviitaleaceae bacterium]|nr:peptidylprolyl isomerase [Defluviitaleaceae bacterium]
MKKIVKKMIFTAFATLGAVFFTACANEDTEWTSRGVAVATLNGVNIYEHEAAVFIRQAKEFLAWDHLAIHGAFEIDFENEYAPGVTFGDAVREQAVRFAATTTVFEAMAADLGIALTDDDLEWIENNIDLLIRDMGAQGLEDALSRDRIYGVNHLRSLHQNQIIFEYLVDYFLASEEAFARFEEYVPPNPTDEIIERAEQLLQRARAGEDFSYLVATYGQDPGMVSSPQGYTFASGVMVHSFEEATRELEIGEISDLVPSSFGVHIIKRVEPNPDEVMGVPGEDEEILAAKHILLSFPEHIPTLMDRQVEAILIGIDNMVAGGEINFLPALENLHLD